MTINKPPKCPNCNTELKQLMCFFWGYKWKCVRCEYEFKTKESADIVANDVKIIVKSKLEEQVKNY
jgi:uncharacterized protein (DUF983 family)